MDQWDHQLLQNSEINMPVNSYIPLFEIILVFIKFGHNHLNFSLYLQFIIFSVSVCV